MSKIYEKFDIYFDSALDLHEWVDMLHAFIRSEIKPIHQAHSEAQRDYFVFYFKN